MKDETPKKKPRGRAPADGASAPRRERSSSGPPVADDPDAALLRLESMGAAGTAAPPAVPDDRATASGGSRRPPASAPRKPRSRPRPAATQAGRRMTARVAAPVVFLVAVIALIGIVVQSGVIGGSTEPTPTPKTGKTKDAQSQSGTKKYVVKSGDSLSSIAARFDTNVGELQELNPDLTNSATLSVGDRILVPTQ